MMEDRSQQIPVRRRAGAWAGFSLPAMLALLLAAALLSGSSRGGPPESEPWVIEGEALTGSEQGGTEIRLPRVRHGVLEIRAEQGWLSPDQDLLTFRGSVRIADTTRVTTAEQGVYRRSTRVLTLTGSVRGRGPEGRFEAGELTWDRFRGRMTLRDQPRITEPDRVIWADRFDYDTEGDEGEAKGRVRLLLLPDSTRAFSDRAEYNHLTRRTLLLGEPRLENPGVAGEADTDISADTLLLDQERDLGEARSHVRIVRGSLRSVAERAVSRLSENQLILFGQPVAWDSDGEIRADTMVVSVTHGDADQLRAYGDVRVHYQPAEKPGENNLIQGDTLIAALRSGAVTDMEMQGSAVSLYLPSVWDAAKGTGRNLCRARTIHVYLSRGEAERADLIREASGTYLYPSESSRRRLLDPAEADSLIPTRLRAHALPPASPGDSASRGTPQEPPPLDPTLAALLEKGALQPPDSLRRPYDRLFNEKVEYQGDTIRFFVPQDRIKILGQGELRYRGNELQSHEINFEAARNLITALGEPELSDQADKVKGFKMTYRTDEREGLIYQGRTAFDNGFYRGEEIKKLPTDELLVRQGDYTTCDHDSAADYHFHANRMKMILKDKVVARPVVLYVKNVPIFALPYYVFPIRKGRQSGITLPDLEVGLSPGRSRFVRNMGYYWAISDYMDARVGLDYYDDYYGQGSRTYITGTYRYAVRYLLDGNFDGSILRGKLSGGGRTEGYSLKGNHRQTIGEATQVTAQADFVSDKNYRGDQDFGAGVDDRLNRILSSTFGLSRRWSRLGLNLSATRREYLDEGGSSQNRIELSGPALDVTVNSAALGRLPDASGRGGRLPALASVTFGTSFRYRHIYNRRFDGGLDRNQAVQQSFSLGDTRKVGPYLRIQPGVSGSWAGFDRDALARRRQFGAVWSASVSAGNTIYGTFRFPFGPLAGFRHVIEPSVGYSYRPERQSLTYVDTLGVRRSVFPSVGGISLNAIKGSSMTLSLGQRFHAKWKRGDEVIKKENLLTWNTSTSYDFLAKRLPGQARAVRFSAIRNSFTLRPSSLLESTADVSHDPYSRAPRSFNISTRLRVDSGLLTRVFQDSAGSPAGSQYGDYGMSEIRRVESGATPRAGAGSALSWSATVNHSYSTYAGALSPSKSLTANTRWDWNPTAHWRFGASVYLDLIKKEVISHSISMYRDLHCWELRLNYNSSGARSWYEFHIGIKEIPEVKYEKQTR